MPTIAGIHGDTAIELLLYSIFDASENRRTITRSTLLQQLERIGAYLAALRDHSTEWNVTVGPLHDEELDPAERDRLRESYRRGVQASWRHILAGADCARPGRLAEVHSKLTTHAAVVVRGASGQGKSSIAFRYASATTGITFGVQGISNSASGVGVLGSSSNSGVIGITTTGSAGVFTTGPGGNILLGNVAGASGWSAQFRVDSDGRGFFNGGTYVGGADFAESVAVAAGPERYEPGDLLVVDPTLDRHLALSSKPYATSVAGIHSTRPGILAMPHSATDGPAAAEVPVAIVGIVPCKVSAENGPIRRGDLLVSSSTPGHAMRRSDRDRMLGAVVGKALGELRQGTGIIEVLVTLQ